MAWLGFGYKNIQSWLDNYIELKPDGLNIFEADSETGKSVYIKCLRTALFFPYKTPKQKRIIIKRPHNDPNKVGEFFVDIDDGSRVLFEFRYTSLTTIVTHPDGTKSSYRNTVPTSVTDLLGLVVDNRTGSILNIMDNETPMLFDSSDEEYNDNLLGFYSHHDDLISRKEFAEETLGAITAKMDRLNTTVIAYMDRLNNIIVKDNTAELKEVQSYLEYYDDTLTKFELLLPVLESLLVPVSEVGNPVVAVDTLETALELSNNLEELIKLVNKVSEVFKEELVYDYEPLVDILSKNILLEKLIYLFTECTKNTILVPVLSKKDSIKLSELCDIIKRQHAIVIILEDLLKLVDKNLNTVSSKMISDLECVYSNSLRLDDFITTLTSLKKCLHLSDDLDMISKALHSQLSETLRTFDRCALCGQSLLEVDIDGIV